MRVVFIKDIIVKRYATDIKIRDRILYCLYISILEINRYGYGEMNE